MTNPVASTAAGVDKPVTLINAYSVPAAKWEKFLDRWRENASFLVGAPGFLRVRMYQAMNDQAEIAFVNVAEWESGAAMGKAMGNPEWQAGRKGVIDDPELEVVTRPMVYQLVADVVPGEQP